MIIEGFPEEYPNLLPFLTLIEYGNTEVLTIVDLVTPQTISVYVLDLCKSEGIDDDQLLAVISLVHANWNAYKDKPISVLFGALDINRQMARVHRTFQASDITRIIGRYPTVDLSPSRTVKRRRRREVDVSLVSEDTDDIID